MRKLGEPPSGVRRRIVKDAIFHGLEDHAIGPLDLSIAPWVRQRGVVDVNEVVLAKVPKLGTRKCGPKVDDDPVGYPETVRDLLDELGRFF